jgi:hypothetical protein
LGVLGVLVLKQIKHLTSLVPLVVALTLQRQFLALKRQLREEQAERPQAWPPPLGLPRRPNTSKRELVEVVASTERDKRLVRAVRADGLELVRAEALGRITASPQVQAQQAVTASP